MCSEKSGLIQATSGPIGLVQDRSTRSFRAQFPSSSLPAPGPELSLHCRHCSVGVQGEYVCLIPVLIQLFSLECYSPGSSMLGTQACWPIPVLGHSVFPGSYVPSSS